MALNSQLIPVVLKGLSQKSASNLSMPGELVTGTNLQILKGGQGGLELSKRYGTTTLTAATNSPFGWTAASPLHMVTLGNQLVIDNVQGVFSRDTAQNKWLAFDRQSFTFSSSTDVISQSLYQKTCPAYAYDASGEEIIAWNDQADRVRFSVRTRDTGVYAAHEIVVANSIAYNAAYQVFAFAPGDGFFYLFYVHSTANLIGVTRITVSNPTAAVSNFSFSGNAQSAPFDVQQTPEGTMVVACRVPATSNTFVGNWNPATQTFSASSTLATAALVNCAWLAQNPFAAGGSRRYYLATVDATNGVKNTIISNVMVLVSSAVVDAATIGGNLVGYFDGSNPITYYDYLVVGQTWNNGIKVAATVWQRSVSFASKAFLIRGLWHCLVRYGSPIQPTLFLFDMASKRICGKVGIEGDMWSNLSLTYGTVTPWPIAIGTKVLFPVLAAHTGLGSTVSNPIGTQIQGISLVAFETVPTTSNPVELGRVLHYPGSIPFIFDGAQCYESGFNVFPEAVTITDAGSGTSKAIGAIYYFRATYVWRDAQGNVYESAPSPAVSYAATTIHDLNIAVSTYRITNRPDVMINVYRTDPDEGTNFRLVNAAPLANAVNVDTVTLLDQLVGLSSGFADWETRASLYNGNGVTPFPVEHLPPPSCTLAWTAQSRVFLAGIDQDPTAVWFSNEVLPGDGVSYFDGFAFRITGNVTAGVSRDRAVVIFTADSIWTVTGEYPDAGAQSFPIPTPFKLPHAIGAINSRSVVVSSIGVFFQSAKGLHLLGWDWSLRYVGADIEDVSGVANIVGGLEVPQLQQVRLYTSTGNTLVWDTVFNSWLTSSGQAALACCNWQSVPYYVDSTGAPHRENEGSYGDDGAFVQSTIQLAIHAPVGFRGWFSLFSLQLLGEVNGPCLLNAQLSYNSNATVVTSYTFGLTLADLVLKQPIRPAKRQAAAYQLTLFDTATSSQTTGGFTLQAITAEVAPQAGPARLPGSQRMNKT